MKSWRSCQVIKVQTSKTFCVVHPKFCYNFCVWYSKWELQKTTLTWGASLLNVLFMSRCQHLNEELHSISKRKQHVWRLCLGLGLGRRRRRDVVSVSVEGKRSKHREGTVLCRHKHSHFRLLLSWLPISTHTISVHTRTYMPQAYMNGPKWTHTHTRIHILFAYQTEKRSSKEKWR